jgi:NADH-quinone oxidoreductase subunit J
MSPLAIAYFYGCAGLAIAGAFSVVIAKNPIRSAMGLLLLVLSVAGLFLELDAQFLAAVQLIVYAGAIVVLFLFVIMLLGPSASTPNDRRGVTVRAASGGLFAAGGLGALVVVVRAVSAAHRTVPLPKADPGFGGIEAFGSVLFADAIVPFELSSALLMVAVIGAIAVARGRQGLKTLSSSESAIAKMASTEAPPTRGQSGVFGHEVNLAPLGAAGDAAKEGSA